MSDRTFVITSGKAMRGEDIKAWQKSVKQLFAKMGIKCPIVVDGVYGVGTRSYTAALVHSVGMSAKTQMKDGVTPDLRRLLRSGKLTPAQRKARDSKSRTAYRARLRKQYALELHPKVHRPVVHILADSWGYHPGVHDGLDVITQPDPVIFAMVKSKVIDVRASGWWGLGAPSNPNTKAKGDGIIQLEVLETVGPFKKGMHIGYGHAEKARVKVGQIVEAGHAIGHAGFANMWHIHLMVNNGSRGTQGVGTQDPRPLLNYAVKNG